MEHNEQNSFEASLASFFTESENAHNKKTFTIKTKEELLAPYFVPRNSTEIFRIIPAKNGEFFSIAHFHYIKVGNRYQKLYCPKHNDSNALCPLCKVVDYITELENKNDAGGIVRKKIFEKKPLTEGEKAIAEKNTKLYTEKKKWIAAKYYILRGIDKQMVKDGIKFWRFKFNKKKEGVSDKLTPVLKQYSEFQKQNPLDFKNGADLILTVADLAMPNNPTRTYKSVTAINYRGPIAVHEDPMIMEKLISETKTWRDVFVKKNPPHISYEEYLTLITKNQAPYYDDSDPKNKKWVYPGNPDLELKANTRSSNQNSTPEYTPDADEDDVETSMSSYTSQQINQHKPVDVTSSTASLMDSILSSNKPAPTPTTQAPTAPTNTTLPTQPGSLDVSDDILKNLPF
jgi:hypothetical protein